MKRALLLVAACGNKAAPLPPPSTIDVHVESNVEAIAIIERLAGSPEYAQATGPYVGEVDKAFATFMDHPSVQLARRLHDSGFAFERPMQFAFDPASNPEFAQAVKQFTTDTSFDAFFANHRAYYAKVEQAYAAQIKASNPLPYFSQLGEGHIRDTVVPALMLGPQNFGVHYNTDAYQLMGLGTVDAAGMPIAIDGDVIVHEMAHAFVNPLVDQHATELDGTAATLFALVKPQMDQQHYTTPRIMLYESIVRAIVANYVRATRGDQAALSEIRLELRRCFVWTAALEQTIGQTKLDTTAIAATLAKAANKGLPALEFLGPIDAVYQRPLAIVTSTAMHDYAAKVNEQIFHGKWPVGEPGDVHPHMSVVAYGSPANNSVVAEVVKHEHWTIAPDGITIGAKHWDGPHLVLIAAVASHDDPHEGIVVYTGADEADLDQINTLRAGSTDYVVGQKTAAGFQVLATGDF